MKAALSRKFIAVNDYLKRSQINHITLHFKELDKKGQTKPNSSRGKGIINIGVEIDEIENRKTNCEIKSCSFEKINKIDKL